MPLLKIVLNVIKSETNQSIYSFIYILNYEMV